MIHVPVLFDNSHLVVVNKPAGVPMHDSERGIVSLLKSQLKTSELFLCHRLDTDTSGCLCLAKTSLAAAAIGEAFTKRTVSKYYLALTDAKPQKKQGTIVGDMKNRRRGQHILTKTKENPAVTQFFSYGLTPGIRATLVKPLTGKTHQIRVALKSLGAPILGDTHYNGTSSDRMYLHAWQLSIPLEDDTICVTAKPDSGMHFTTSEFEQWTSKISEPDKLSWPTIAPSLLAKVCGSDDILPKFSAKSS